jgi:hypothetical protein
MKVYKVEFGYEYSGEFCNSIRIAMNLIEDSKENCNLFEHEDDAIKFAYEFMNKIRDNVYCSVDRYKSVSDEDVVIKEDFTDYARFDLTVYAFIEKVEVR